MKEWQNLRLKSYWICRELFFTWNQSMVVIVSEMASFAMDSLV